MTGTRLFLRTGRQDAAAIFTEFERIFEDDGFALTVNDCDDDALAGEVSVYTTHDMVTAVMQRMSKVAGSLGVNVPVEIEALPDIDWVSHSLEGLKPVRAGRIIVYGSHDRDMLRPADLPILIEAGQAFGTGHHGTTWGCLSMIQDVLKREKPRNALDLGTGSAVLAIALAKLAHLPIIATDIDPVALGVARGNLRLNGVANHIETHVATGFRHPVFEKRGPFGLIVANILARPLMALAPEMTRHLAAGGSLILSGILESQRRRVIAAYVDTGFRHVKTIGRDGWVTIHIK